MLNFYKNKEITFRFGKAALLSSFLFLSTANAQENCTVPQNFTTGNGIAHTTLAWDVPSTLPAYGYEWEVRLTGSETIIQSGSVQNTSLLIQNLSANTEYTFTVRAHCATMVYSEWATEIVNTRALSASLTTQIGTGADANAFFGSSYGPIMYANIVQRNGSVANMLFTEAEMETAGIPQGAGITGVAFNKINAANNNADTYPETRVRVLAANSETVAPLSMLTTLGDIEDTHTELMDNADYQLPDTIGWIDFNFDTPFTYNGQSLEIATVMYQNGQTAPFSTWITWQYTAGFRDYMIGAWPINTVPLDENVVLSHNNGGGQYKDRPNMQVYYTVSNVPVIVTATTTDGAPAEITVNNGTLQLAAAVAPATASQTLVWEISEGTEFATIDQNGLISGFANGDVVARAVSADDGTVFGEITIVISGQAPCSINFPDNAEPISLVQFAGINNDSETTTGGITPAYEDFKTLIPAAEVALGQEYTITVKGNTNGPFTHQVVAYIDWNKNNSFEDEGEAYIIGALVNSTGTDDVAVSSTITVPTDAPLGVTTMRVTKKFNVAALPCNTLGYGQAEDYSLNVNREIVAGADGIATTLISLYPNPTTDNVHLQTEQEIKSIEVFNSLGQSVIKANGKDISLATLSNGIYLLKADTVNGKNHTFRVVKK
ncbi:GEVED domain-containing protein [Flavobacterium rivuli]|nr:GEVED domain-containing protein [Flavobacterium rivuli]